MNFTQQKVLIFVWAGIKKIIIFDTYLYLYQQESKEQQVPHWNTESEPKNEPYTVRNAAKIFVIMKFGKLKESQKIRIYFLHFMPA